MPPASNNHDEMYASYTFIHNVHIIYVYRNCLYTNLMCLDGHSTHSSYHVTFYNIVLATTSAIVPVLGFILEQHCYIPFHVISIITCLIVTHTYDYCSFAVCTFLHHGGLDKSHRYEVNVSSSGRPPEMKTANHNDRKLRSFTSDGLDGGQSNCLESLLSNSKFHR